jgi:hypothetical protein
LIGLAAAGASLIAIGAIAFGLSIRFGMLLGRRLDRALQERPPAGDAATAAAASNEEPGPGHNQQGGTSTPGGDPR